MENKKLRHQKFKSIAAQHASLVELGHVLDMNPRRLSQLKNGSKQIGDRTARHIEAKLGKHSGWMDTPDDPSVSVLAALGTDKMLLQLINLYSELCMQQKHELVAHANSLLATTIKTPTTAAPFAGVIKKVKT